MANRALYRRTRDLHQYLGLVASPFVLLYAVTAVGFNHAIAPGTADATRAAPVRHSVVAVRALGNSLEIAKDVERRLGLTGEIDYVNLKPKQQRLSFPVTRPGARASVVVDLATGATTVEAHRTGRWDAALYLHKMPGPHNASVRGNWVFIRLWGWLADTSVYLILFATASGIYLWAALKHARRVGLLFLGAGFVSFVAIVALLLP